MRRALLLTVIMVFGAGVVAAHVGVENPAVMARMHAMKDIGTATETLGKMAKGEIAFDADRARAAAAVIAEEAAATPALFEAREDDPKSEALPTIWDQFDDFTAKSLALRDTATGLAETLVSAADLRRGLAEIGASCRACHELYRQ